MNYYFPLASGPEHSKVNFAYGAIYSAGGTHKGLDLDATNAWIDQHGGNPAILATIGGKVTAARTGSSGWGNYCTIQGSDGYYHTYAHMQARPVVSVDQTVQAGQQLGILGNSGNSTGDHLHYEVRQGAADGATTLDPSRLLGIANVTGKIQGGTAAPTIASAGNIPTVPLNIPYEELSIVPDSAQKGDIIFGRRYRLIVADDKGEGIELSDLHITFNIIKTYLFDLQYSIINVYNINRDTEAFILRKGTQVILEAGYEGTNYGEIYRGDIVQPLGFYENGTDYVMRLVAADGDRFLSSAFTNHSFERGLTQRQAAESLVSQATVPTQLNKISDALNTNTLPRGKVFFGMTKDYLNQIAKGSAATMYISDGKVNIVKATDPDTDRILRLSPQSGLIGTPQQTELGIKAKCLLLPQLQIGRSVQIDPQYIQERQLAAGTIQTMLDKQGVYRIAKVTYTGDNRGNDWYAEIEAMTQAGYLPAMLANAAGNPF